MKKLVVFCLGLVLFGIHSPAQDGPTKTKACLEVEGTRVSQGCVPEGKKPCYHPILCNSEIRCRYAKGLQYELAPSPAESSTGDCSEWKPGECTPAPSGEGQICKEPTCTKYNPPACKPLICRKCAKDVKYGSGYQYGCICGKPPCCRECPPNPVGSNGTPDTSYVLIGDNIPVCIGNAKACDPDTNPTCPGPISEPPAANGGSCSEEVKAVKDVKECTPLGETAP